MNIRQIRALFINPNPRRLVLPPFNPQAMYRARMIWFRTHVWKIYFGTILISLVVGILISTASALTTYSDFGIKDVFRQPEGMLWDFLWWLRGQPAGWEENPDAIFVLLAPIKLDWDYWTFGHVRGINGPLTLLGCLTEWFVDLAIYFPKFIDPGWLAVNVDMIPGIIAKIGIDFGILFGLMLALIIILPIISFFIAYYLPGIILFLLSFLGPLAKLLFGLFVISYISLLLTGNMNFIEEFTNFMNSLE